MVLQSVTVSLEKDRLPPPYPHVLYLHSGSTASVKTYQGGYAGVSSQKNNAFSTIPGAQHFSSHKCYSYCYPGNYCHCLLCGHSPKSDHRLEKSQALSVDGSMVECDNLFTEKGYSLLSISVGLSAFVPLYPKF